jgi:hypothetical protein
LTSLSRSLQEIAKSYCIAKNNHFAAKGLFFSNAVAFSDSLQTS